MYRFLNKKNASKTKLGFASFCKNMLGYHLKNCIRAFQWWYMYMMA